MEADWTEETIRNYANGAVQIATREASRLRLWLKDEKANSAALRSQMVDVLYAQSTPVTDGGRK